ncbi:MAG TPA: hypothetical protein VF221_17130 [Chloroflexota bacterium]
MGTPQKEHLRNLAETEQAALRRIVQASIERVDRVVTELGEVSLEPAASIMQEGMATDGTDSLACVRCPLLVVSARAPVDIDRLRDLKPEALVGRVVGSGHWLTLAVPHQVNAMLDRFLEIIARRGCRERVPGTSERTGRSHLV